MDNEDAVREELLIRHAPEFTELLDMLDGHVQMTVRALYAEDALLTTVVADDPALARRSAELRAIPELAGREERIELGRLIAERVAARREHDEQALLDGLSPFATELRLDPPSSERVALNAQLLVRRDRRDALDAAVGVLGETLKGYLALRYIGPLPPYSFADLSLEAGGE
jgi:hypothetical protein